MITRGYGVQGSGATLAHIGDIELVPTGELSIEPDGELELLEIEGQIDTDSGETIDLVDNDGNLEIGCE